MVKGYKVSTGIKVAVTFPVDLFETIKARAEREGRKFSEQVVYTVEAGELALSECDADEPKPTMRVVGK